MTTDLTEAIELPAPVPAHAGQGVELRMSHERDLLARAVLLATGGFAVAVALLLILGAAVIA
ncbi:hypothetical protein [Microbacterium sp. BDGP8]|uniref:hypothetical protein n=1 Tax=Microbacterium sp. BDGP8 TaxID=3035531 RepID=UPI00249E0043|nr:hypothetical protein [Microbacterium sp. BDGP8]WHE35180.1 hypothetical protein P6897_10775 [Microbacterium sp. BDGP8]